MEDLKFLLEKHEQSDINMHEAIDRHFDDHSRRLDTLRQSVADHAVMLGQYSIMLGSHDKDTARVELAVERMGATLTAKFADAILDVRNTVATAALATHEAAKLAAVAAQDAARLAAVAAQEAAKLAAQRKSPIIQAVGNIISSIIGGVMLWIGLWFSHAIK